MMLDDVGCAQPRVFLQTDKKQGDLGFVLQLYRAIESYMFNFKVLCQGMASLQEQLFIAATFVKNPMITVGNTENVIASPPASTSCKSTP
jgi:hypothetical protein